MATRKRDSNSHDEVVSEMLRTDPEFRAEMINEVMSDGDHADMIILLRQLKLADGGMQVVAQRTVLKRRSNRS